MIKKAIFGGTFDPIHNGHLNIAYEALYEFGLDKIIFIPSGNPPHKVKKRKTDAFLRYEMVKMAIKDEEKFEVSSYEINRNSLSYTYETLKHFTTLEKNTEWYFISGADCLMDIEGWKNSEQIFKLCKLVVFNRPGYDKEKLLNKKNNLERKYSINIFFLDKPMLNISSTTIRNYISEEKNSSYLMPENVYNFAIELRLYNVKYLKKDN